MMTDKGDEEFFKQSRERFRRQTSGEVPWSREGMLEAWEFFGTILDTPHDDYPVLDLGPRPADTLPPPSPKPGEAAIEVRLNRFHPHNQISAFILRKYGREEGGCHLWRFMEADSFLRKWRKRLLGEDLLRDGEIELSLVSALATLPMTQRRRKRGEEQFAEFNLDEVLARAAEIRQQEEQQP